MFSAAGGFSLTALSLFRSNPDPPRVIRYSSTGDAASRSK
jgi:hypothetical protein